MERLDGTLVRKTWFSVRFQIDQSKVNLFFKKPGQKNENSVYVLADNFVNININTIKYLEKEIIGNESAELCFHGAS